MKRGKSSHKYGGKEETMKKKFLSLVVCIAMILTLIPQTIFAADEAERLDQGEVRNSAYVTEENYQIIDGQAVKTTQMATNSNTHSGVVELNGYTNSTATYDESEVAVNGNTVLTITGNDMDSSVQPRAYNPRQAKPAFGKPEDYSINKGTSEKNITFQNIIAGLTVAAVFAVISPFVANTYAFIASALIGSAVAAMSNAKTSILKETTYANKTIPGLYHKYVQKWYLKNDKGEKKYVPDADSVCYDYWS